jgi:predicted RNase H-like HicB family nuclease
MAYSAAEWLRTGEIPAIEIAMRYTGRARFVITVNDHLAVDAQGWTVDKAARAALEAFEQWCDDRPEAIENALTVSIAEARAEREAGR